MSSLYQYCEGCKTERGFKILTLTSFACVKCGKEFKLQPYTKPKVTEAKPQYVEKAADYHEHLMEKFSVEPIQHNPYA